MKLTVKLKDQRKCSGCPALYWQPVFHFVCKAGYYGKFCRHRPRSALPFLGHLEYTCKTPRVQLPQPGYPVNPKTIGEHIRKVRMDKGLIQKQVGKMIGVDECTITNWEIGRTKPQIHHIPKVIEFLGYVPFESPNDPIGRLRHFKLVNGLNYEELGERIARDPEQLTDWLSGRVKPCERNIRRINKFLSSV